MVIVTHNYRRTHRNKNCCCLVLYRKNVVVPVLKGLITVVCRWRSEEAQTWSSAKCCTCVFHLRTLSPISAPPCVRWSRGKAKVVEAEHSCKVRIEGDVHALLGNKVQAILLGGGPGYLLSFKSAEQPTSLQSLTHLCSGEGVSRSQLSTALKVNL